MARTPPIALLNRIKFLKPKAHKMFLKRATDDEIRSLCDCLLSVDMGLVPLNKIQFIKLSRNKRQIRHVINPRFTSISKKRKYLIQNGGTFLTSIASAILSYAQHGQKDEAGSSTSVRPHNGSLSG
jgi:hypothetical protein